MCFGKKPEKEDKEHDLNSASIPMSSEKDQKHKVPGPVSKRKCRDIFWGILFILYWVGMFILSGFAISKGNVNILLYGVDSEGNTCGQTNSPGGRDLTGLNYLYYFNYTDPIYGYQRCISACPQEFLVFVGPFPNSPSLAICTYDYPQPNDTASLKIGVDSGNCTEYILDTTSVVGRCIPSLSALVNTTTIEEQYIKSQFTQVMNSRGFSLNFYEDLYSARYVILMCAGISVVLSFAWLILLQLCGGVMVLLTIFFVCGGLGGATAYLWYNWNQLRLGQAIVGGELTVIVDYGFSSYVYTQNTFFVFAIILSVFTAIVYLALFFMRKRIMLAVTVIKLASKAVKKMPSLVIFPFLKFLMLIALTAWFVYIMINLATAGTITQVTVYSYTYQSNYVLEYLQIYFVMGFFWTWNFITAIGDTTIAGAIAVWYWTMDKKKLPFFIVLPSLYRTFRYHLGSLAFGSFIIALVQTIRYILYKLQNKFKGKENPFLKAMFVALQCFFMCLERFLKFLNKNAYIEIAIYGHSFCKSAKWAMQIITRNILRVVAVDKIGDFFMLMGKIAITVLTGIAGNLLIEKYSDNPTFWVTPMIIICFLAYGIAYCFMAVLDMAILTIFLSFCEDSERNDGSPEKPYYMVPKLMKYLDKDSKEKTDLTNA